MTADPLQLTASMEDYLEAIYRLSKEKRVVRVRDVAKAVDVTPPSATGAIKGLKRRGLVSHEKYEDVLLTKAGESIAADVHARHEELRSFFEEVLLLDPGLSESEACALEHSISTQTLQRLRRFLSCIRECGDGQPGCIRNFRHLVDADKPAPDPRGAEATNAADDSEAS